MYKLFIYESNNTYYESQRVFCSHSFVSVRWRSQNSAHVLSKLGWPLFFMGLERILDWLIIRLSTLFVDISPVTG